MLQLGGNKDTLLLFFCDMMGGEGFRMTMLLKEENKA